MDFGEALNQVAIQRLLSQNQSAQDQASAKILMALGDEALENVNAKYIATTEHLGKLIRDEQARDTPDEFLIFTWQDMLKSTAMKMKAQAQKAAA